MKRFLSLILAFLLLAAVPLSAAATHVSTTEAADALAALGLLRGTGEGFQLERTATRAEAAALMLRLAGLEAEALAETDACPFDDGGWAAPMLTYAGKIGLLTGQSATHFGSAEPVSCRDWLTMLLRVLGYSDAQGDFTWRESVAFADAVGLCHGEYTASGPFLREDLALLAYTALTLPLKGGEETLAQKLYRAGAVTGSALRAAKLGYTVPTDKREFNAAELHARSASAVVLVDAYADEEALRKDRSFVQGSGFFITADGVAALCYHEIDGCSFARVTTLDGRRFDVTGVLGYDPLWDYAIVRVSQTDLEGNTVRFFPYLDLGDSDEVYAGEPVYTLSNALALVDNITDGLVSNPAREVDDPDYLCIQFTAPISHGSSGGALFNRFGEVVGVLYGAFSDGNSMNLAVPVNVIAALNLTGEGTPLSQVRETEDAKKAAATISVPETEIEMVYGEELELLVTHTGPNCPSLKYSRFPSGVVDCTWGSFTSKHSVPITLEAVGDGEAEITISFSGSGYSDDSSIVIHVTVTGSPEEPEESEEPEEPEESEEPEEPEEELPSDADED